MDGQQLSRARAEPSGPPTMFGGTMGLCLTRVGLENGLGHVFGMHRVRDDQRKVPNLILKPGKCLEKTWEQLEIHPEPSLGSCSDGL